MKTTYFLCNNGNISSERHRNNGISFTNYPSNSSFGGVTFHSGGMISRFSQSGQFLGSGFKSSGNNTLYLDSHGKISNKLVQF